jgi:hypothetical protein
LGSTLVIDVFHPGFWDFIIPFKSSSVIMIRINNMGIIFKFNPLAFYCSHIV